MARWKTQTGLAAGRAPGVIPAFVKTLVIGVPAFLVAAACARAGYPIGSREVPAVVVHADAAAFAVYAQHPRLFFRDTDLPEIRRRIAGDFKAEWTEMLADLNRRALARPAKGFGEGVFLKSWETGRDMAFVAAVTGDPKYVAWAKDWAAALVAAGPVGNDDHYRGRLQSLAVAYDWLYPWFNDAEKSQLQAAILAHIERNWSFAERGVNYISGHSRWGNFALAAGLLAIVTERPEVRPKLLTVRDHWVKGYFPAQGWIATDGGYHMGWAYSAAYLTGNIHLAWSTATNECVFFPWQALTPLFWIYGRQGDGFHPNTGDAYTVSQDLNPAGRGLLLIAAGILKNPYAAGMIGPSRDRFADVLYGDKRVPRKTPTDAAAPLPLSRHFRHAGVVLARDSWDQHATHLQFRSTSFYSMNHHHREENTFTLHYRGALAIDSGLYDEYGTAHWRNYFTRTIAHNGIVVVDPAQKMVIFGQPVSNDGGQTARTEPGKLTDLLPGGHAHLAGITRFEETGDYMYASGDATKAYDPERVRLAERELVYLRKAGRAHPIIVVLDRVESARPDFEKRFLLHTVNEPRVQGRLAAAENKGGRLSCLTLLPAEAKIERIGGPGREAWVNGVNHPFSVARPKGPEFTAGAWRIEVSPAVPATRDTFLHVLFVDDADAPPVEARAAELVQSARQVGVRVGGWTVMFPLDAGGAAQIARTAR